MKIWSMPSFMLGNHCKKKWSQTFSPLEYSEEEDGGALRHEHVSDQTHNLPLSAPCVIPRLSIWVCVSVCVFPLPSSSVFFLHANNKEPFPCNYSRFPGPSVTLSCHLSAWVHVKHYHYKKDSSTCVFLWCRMNDAPRLIKARLQCHVMSEFRLTESHLYLTTLRNNLSAVSFSGASRIVVIIVGNVYFCKTMNILELDTSSCSIFNLLPR